MPRILKSLPPYLACVFLGGALIFAQVPAEKPAAPTPASPPRTAAEQLLDASVGKTGSLSGFDTTFTHTILTRGTKAKTKGRLALAPGRKVFFEIHVEVADGKGMFKVICNGESIYHIRQIGGEKGVTKFELEQLDKAREELKEPGGLEAAQAQELVDDLMSEHGFTGVTALLTDLKKRMAFAGQESTVLARADGKSVPVYLLDGEWTEESVKKIAPPKQSTDPSARDPQKLWKERRPEYLLVPRRCRIYLSRDGAWPWTDSLWPLRIEWWGLATPGASDVVLVAVDFTAPSRQTPDSLFQLAEDEKKLKSQDVDVVAIARARKAARQRALENQERSALTPLTPPATPPAKP